MKYSMRGRVPPLGAVQAWARSVERCRVPNLRGTRGHRLIDDLRSPAYRTSRTLAKEHVVRGIGCAEEGAGLVAGPAQHAARGVDPLDGDRAREHAVAALRRHFKLEPGNVLRG